MATSAIGTTVPAGSDVFDPQGADVAYDASLRSRVIIPAANATARTGLIATCGWTPSAGEPLRVWQVDTRVEWVYDGTTWYQSTVPDASDTGWQAVPLNTGAGVSAYTTAPYSGIQYRVKAGVGYVTGAAVKAGGFPAGTVIGTLPAGARPTVPVDAVSNSAGSQITIRSDGTITAGVTLTSPFAMTAVAFPVG